MAFVIEDIKARLEALDGLLADVSAGPDDDRRLAAPGASPHTAHRPGP